MESFTIRLLSALSWLLLVPLGVVLDGCGQAPAPRSEQLAKISASVADRRTNEIRQRTNQFELLVTNATPVPSLASVSSGLVSNAAAPKDPVTLYNRGVRLYRGDATVQDFATAAKLFREAADLGHSGAQHNLAVFYLNGFGVDKNVEQAAVLLRKAAEQGLAEAQFKLASLYATGVGLTQDLHQAAAWVRKAAEQGHTEAEYNLATLLVSGRGAEPNLAEAIQWYRKAAEKGKATAQSNLGVFYASGKGVPRDPSEAVKWFRKAAEQGYPTAQYNLAKACVEGKAIEKDLVEAYKWYLLAAGNGDTDAANEQLELSFQMTQTQVSEGIRRANLFTLAHQTNRPPAASALLPAESGAGRF